MTIDQLKFIILQQRQLLAFLYEHKQFLKNMKRFADEHDMTSEEYDAHNFLKATSKQIAKLVEIQKSLKADVRRMLERGRHMAGIKKRGAIRRAVAEKFGNE